MSAYRPFGLKGSMTSMLFIIGKSGGISQKKLAQMLILDPSTVSRDLNKLKKKEWIMINKGLVDSRRSDIQLTNKGWMLLEEIAPVWNKVHNKIESILGEHNIHQIDKITTVLKSNMSNIES